MPRFLSEKQRKAVVDTIIGLPIPDCWHALGYEVCMAVETHLESCFELPVYTKPVDIHPSVLKAQYRYGV